MQFKDLQKSYQVYILYKGEKIRHKMGTVVSIANPRFQPLQPGQLSYQQPQDKIVDLEVSVDGVSSTFVVRENMTVEVRNDITISCDRDPILNEINAIMRNSNDILNSVEKHKSILEDCENIVKDLNPVLAVDSCLERAVLFKYGFFSLLNHRVGGVSVLDGSTATSSHPASPIISSSL